MLQLTLLRWCTIPVTLLFVTLFYLPGWSDVVTSCVAIPDTTCVNPDIDHFIAVGNEVATLSGTLRVCLGEVAGTGTEYASVRIVLVIDRSYSLCRNPTNANGCCSSGDSSGNCMMNDPNDMRILAAHLFVDTLAKLDPKTEVGVISFDRQTTISNPLPLSSEVNIAGVHRSIDAASCVSIGYPPLIDSLISSSPALEKSAAVKATYIGAAVEAGLKAVDNNFSDMPASMYRHVIILTDGAWDDAVAGLSTPDTIVNKYHTAFPDRQVPFVHGIFLSNKELHAAHGYTEDGCSSTSPVEPGKLERLTVLTNGYYFALATPSTIVDNFISLRGKLADEQFTKIPQQEVSLSLTSATKSNQPLSSTIVHHGTLSILEARLPNLPLENGLNTIILTRILKIPGKIDSTATITFTIFRDTQGRNAPETGPFRVRCEPQQAIINFPATPGLLITEQPQPSDASFNLLGRKFVKGNIGGTTPAGVLLNRNSTKHSGKRNISVK